MLFIEYYGNYSFFLKYAFVLIIYCINMRINIFYVVISDNTAINDGCDRSTRPRQPAMLRV